MLMNSCFDLTVRCEDCGIVEFHDIALFQINQKELKLHCTCGAEKLSINYNDNAVNISVSCDICGNNHIYRYGLADFLSNMNRIENCPHAGTNILWIGHGEWIKQEILQNKSINVKTNFFNNPVIMMDILEWLYNMKDKDYLKCECGGEGKDIGINLFPDRVELYCKKCQGLSVIYAETEEDLNNLLKTNRILIHEKSFACIDAINFRGSINNK